jgi:hypothetical protein
MRRHAIGSECHLRQGGVTGTESHCSSCVTRFVARPPRPYHPIESLERSNLPDE